MRRTPRIAILSGLASTAILAVGCGADDFPNDPRPAAPIEVTASVDDRKIKVSPSDITPGLTSFTISNTSENTVTIVLDGPTTGQSLEIGPGSTGEFKTNLESGDYTVTAEGAPKLKPTDMNVAGERESSQNELLLP